MAPKGMRREGLFINDKFTKYYVQTWNLISMSNIYCLLTTIQNRFNTFMVYLTSGVSLQHLS